MHKFNGMYMERRRKQTGEQEAKMEGSSEDSEPQVLAGFTKELQHSINQTESTLEHHVHENQETMHRGQSEMRETLEKVNSNEEKIVKPLLQMTHVGKGPKIYANKEASGSHGGTRPHQQHSPHYHTKGRVYGGGPPQGPTHSRATPRPYLPTFLDNQPQRNYEDEIEDNSKQYVREYHALSAGFQRRVTLDQYCGIKFMGKPKQYQRSNYELERKAGKMEIPYFDGSSKVTVQAWVQKLDTYLQLNPMRELDAIKFSTMYLEGKARDWWYHGLTTLGHNHITSYT